MKEQLPLCGRLFYRGVCGVAMVEVRAALVRFARTRFFYSRIASEATLHDIIKANDVARRCFGLLLTPGRNVKQGDMHLLDMDRAVVSEDHGGIHSVSGTWDPTAAQFALLNTETQKGDCVLQLERRPVFVRL